MTGRERVRRCFERRPHDRVPRHESFWWETIARFEGEGLRGGGAGLFDRLQTDMAGIGWFWPMAYPGRRETVAEDEQTLTVREGNGRVARYWKHKSGTPEHIGFECDSRQRWEREFKPSLLRHALQFDAEALKRQYAAGRQAGRWCYLPAVEAFEETRSLMGDEITLLAMVDDPEWVVDVSRTFTDVVLRNSEAVLDLGIEPDGIWIYGDMAYRSATICSPAMYRALIWPDHRRLADWAHARGMKCIFHTDGNVNGVIDLYIEAGFDALQPLEAKAGMDLRRLGPRYGSRLTFFGNCDVMIYATNDLAAIEAEIAAKLAAGRATGSYIYHSDHSVPPQVSWATYQAIIDLVDRHGRYERGRG